MASVLPTMCDCGTLDREAQMQTPVKRLTMVERARLEALAAFGNEGFESMSVKKDDFRTKLKSSAIKTNSKTQPRILTRLERAKMDAHSAFKNIKLGEKNINYCKKRKFHESNSENKDPKKQNLTRLQKAKDEVAKAFDNVSLATIPKKRSRLEQEKLSKKVEWDSPRQPHLYGGLSGSCKNGSTKRITRSHSAKLEAIRSSGGNGIETKSNQVCQDVAAEIPSQEENISKVEGKEEPKRLTRIEKAKLEAIESFKGQQLEDICKESTKIVAKFLKAKKVKGQKVQTTFTTSVTPVTSSHKKECAVTPVPSSHIRKQNTSVTPLPTSHKKERSSKPNIDIYTSIYGDDNFKDHTVLLETSKRVVETAVSLETPEGSPMVATGKQ